MENIKTFDTIEEAMEYKPIWPDYDLQYTNYRVGLKTHVRKQDNDGIWQLILVLMNYDLSVMKDSDFEEERAVNSEKQASQILDVVKIFTARCYKVLLFWKFPEKGKELVGANGKPVGGVVDKDQQSEYDRLRIGI